MKGSLLGAQQDAVMKLDDFPMAMLQPIFRAVPALQHAAPAVAAPGSSPPAAELLTRMNIPFLKCAASCFPLPFPWRIPLPPPVHAIVACLCDLQNALWSMKSAASVCSWT